MNKYIIISALALSCCTIANIGAAEIKDSLVHVAKNCNTDTCRVRIYNRISDHLHTRDTKEALQYALKATQIARSGDMDHVISQSINNIGISYWHMGKYNMSVKYFKEAIKINTIPHDLKALGNSYDYLGLTYIELEDDSLALAYLLKGLEIREGSGDKYGQSFSYNNLFAFYWGQQDLTEAMYYLQKALQINQEIDNKEGIARCYANMGSYFYAKGKLKKALSYYNNAFNTYKELNHQRHIATLYNNRGTVYVELGNHQAGISELKKALKIRQQLNDQAGQASTLQGIGEAIYASGKNYEKSMVFCNKALNMSKSTMVSRLTVDIYESMYKISKESGHIDEALAYMELSNMIKDSLARKNQLKQLSEMRIRYETEKKEQELLTAQQEKQLLLQENQLKESRQQLLILSIVLIVLLGGITVIKLKNTLYKTRIEKQQTQEELTSKTRELESFAVRIKEKNEFLRTLKETLRNISSQHQSTDEMREVSNAIKHNLYLDNDRRDLEMRIEEIHQSLLNKLEKKFPKLTKSEKRLCSLIVSELSTKHIAEVLNITPESVRKNRYRLRKKFGLKRHGNLVQFLRKT